MSRGKESCYWNSKIELVRGERGLVVRFCEKSEKARKNTKKRRRVSWRRESYRVERRRRRMREAKKAMARIMKIKQRQISIQMLNCRNADEAKRQHNS